MKRAVLIVIDSLGIGAMSDAPSYGDAPESNTLANLSRACGGLRLPNLASLGIGNLTQVAGVPPVEQPIAAHGIMEEASRGKDSTTGHWELAGIVSEQGFKVYPDGFPEDMMQEFIRQTGCGGYLGNIPASGTAIIDQYHEEHIRTGFPIIYTSADSVFQIACDIARISLGVLYEWCAVARTILDQGYNCSRVIARPYEATAEGLKRLGESRKDYSVPPPPGSVLERIVHAGGRVIAVGKTEDLFVSKGITHSIHTGANREGLKQTIALLKNEIPYHEIQLDKQHNKYAVTELIFTNLVDTDMIFGHRRDPQGYGKALEEIDASLAQILPLIGKDDLLIISADHGCDPTAAGTDHTREKVPLLIYNPALKAVNLGTKPSFTYVARRIAEWLGVNVDPTWTT